MTNEEIRDTLEIEGLAEGMLMIRLKEIEDRELREMAAEYRDILLNIKTYLEME